MYSEISTKQEKPGDSDTPLSDTPAVSTTINNIQDFVTMEMPSGK